MDVRLRIAVASDELNVSAFCREHGVSRQTFYEWRRRYLADGLEGLEPRSRAPRTSPRRVGADVEDAVVALRKELAELGVDTGLPPSSGTSAVAVSRWCRRRRRSGGCWCGEGS
jgi:transposase-like protein